MTRTELFERFPRWRGIMPKGYVSFDFLGIKTKADYFAGLDKNGSEKDRYIETDYPPIDEEYFEWVTLLEAVISADSDFSMIELGAGWGRWICRAAKLCQHLSKKYHLTGVEPNKQHFQWMFEHICVNLSLEGFNFLNKMIGTANGYALLSNDSPDDTYGQSYINPAYLFSKKVAVVRSTRLDTILKTPTDLIDMDIQGMEHKVIKSSIKLLNWFVKRLYIETHSEQIEVGLRKTLIENGWKPIFDFPYHSILYTDRKAIKFGGGVQSWVNSRKE